MREGRPVQPVSPYGVTKLAAEHLCYLYWKNYGVPTVSLRYLPCTPAPDKGSTNSSGRSERDAITVYGDGTQTRDFTYIDDVVEANVLAATSDVRGRSSTSAAGTGSA